MHTRAHPRGRNTRRLVIAACAGGLVVVLVVALLPVLLLLGVGTADSAAADCTTGQPPAAGESQPAGDTAQAAAQGVDDLDQVQTTNATTVVAVGRQMRVPDFGIVVALATASQESKFRNYANDGKGGDLRPDQSDIARSLQLPHDAVGTDHGSVGIFQQQYPWWGTLEQLMDPATSARKFYAALTKVPRWQNLELTVAAQRVQRSAFPDDYADDEPLARRLLTELSGTQAASTGATGAAGAADLCGAGSAMTCPPSGLNVEDGLTPDAVRVVRCVVATFGIKTLGGLGDRGNNPGSDHPSGRAVDVMIADWDQPTGNAAGWKVARWAQTNAAGLGITYIIFDAQIWSTERAKEGWRPYTHPSGGGGATLAHEDHVHISVSGNAAADPTDASGSDVAGGGTVLPIASGKYELTSGFGRRSGVAGAGVELHTGQDFAAPSGTPIVASRGGTVTFAGRCSCGYGNYVVIKAGTWSFYYAHQVDGGIRVRKGQQVRTGQQIGAVGSTGRSTGNHLHFEVRRGGRAIDPLPWLRQQGLRP